MKFGTLKKRMEYFKNLTDYRLIPNSYIIVMVDGNNFRHMVKNRYKLPFDDEFISMMNETAIYVCENVQGCKIAYTQSDEISFIITDFDTPDSGSFYGLRLCKMQSVIASLATARFNQLAMVKIATTPASQSDICQMMEDYIPVQFDCKAWNVPTYNDSFAWLKYRQIDCVRNSKQQAAQEYLSYSALLGKDADKQIEMLKEAEGIDWNTDYDNGKKYGRLIYKEAEEFDDPKYGKYIRTLLKAHNSNGMITKEWFDQLGVVPNREN